MREEAASWFSPELSIAICKGPRRGQLRDCACDSDGVKCQVDCDRYVWRTRQV